MLRRSLGLLALLLLSSSAADAQFLKKLRNSLDDLGPAPEVKVTINHPPNLGLEVSRVAFGPEEGECAGDFVDALISDFTQNGIEVVNRRQIEALLAEHEFSLSGLVNRDDAVELGKILGPAALVFVSVRRCAAEQQPLTDSSTNYMTGGKNYVYISRTTAYFRASLQVVDLATARIHRAKTVDKQATQSNRSSEGRPEFPSEFTVTDRALREAASEVHRWFFPWTEWRTLKFFDDTDCNLKLAYNLVQGGDFQGAREQSVENVRACEVYRSEKPKLTARALYNLGMTEFLLRNYDAALEAFDESLRIDDLDPTPQAIADCRRAKESELALEAELEELGDDATVTAAPPGAAEPTRTATRSQEPDDDKTLEERLEELTTLREKGLISEEVYEKKQAELLEDL